jgi:hypothetical protein
MILPKKEDSNVTQIHKRFTDEQIMEFIQKYLRKEVERKHLQEVLGINK